MMLRVALGLGLIGFLGMSGAIEWSRLLGLVRAWETSAGALLLLLLVLLASSWRLCLLLSGQGLRLSVGAAVRLNLIGGWFGNFLPGSNGGDLIRIYLAARPNPGRRPEIAATLIVDRLVGLFTLLLAALLIAAVANDVVSGSAALRGLTSAAILSLAGLIALFAIGMRPDGPLRRLVREGVGRTRAGDAVERLLESIRTYRNRGRIALAAVLVSLLIQALGIAALQLILLANGAPSVNWTTALLVPFGMLANALPLTPGGLGVGEAAFESLFLVAGAAGGAEAILTWRVMTTLIDLSGAVLFIAGRTNMVILPDAVPAADSSEPAGATVRVDSPAAARQR